MRSKTSARSWSDCVAHCSSKLSTSCKADLPVKWWNITKTTRGTVLVPRNDLRGWRSRELRDAGLRDGRHRHGAKLVLLRREVLLRVHRHVPGDDLARVGRHTAHDRHERASRHPVAVVERPAGAD